MEEKKRPITKWLYWFLFAVAIIIVYKTLDNFTAIGAWIKNLLDILMPFIIGVLLAYLLYIPSRKIERMYLKVKKPKIVSKKARGLSIFTVYVIVILLIIVAFKFLIPVISESIIDLINNFQGYYNLTMQNIDSLPEDSFLRNEIVLDIINNVKSIDLKQFINMDRLAQYAKGAIDFASKENTYKNMGKYFNRTNEIFFNFLAGQFIDGIIVGIITSIAMSVMGVKYAVLLGFMIGLFNLIPYFGAIIAVVISTLITLLTGGFWQAFTMVIVITVLQQVDANIINPKIIGSSLKISPLLVIFGVTVGGAYFGVWGMFLAVPLIAVCKLLLTDYIECKNKSKN